jgi:hypothetical protein
MGAGEWKSLMIELMNTFPRLRHSIFSITSPIDKKYNCIAWVAEDTNNFWWPVGRCYWPSGAPRIVTPDAFIVAFETVGYRICDNELYEEGFVKIAIFVKDDGSPAHAARQLSNGRWTSKCGTNKDIEHELTALCGQFYGQVHCYMKKPA